MDKALEYNPSTPKKQMIGYDKSQGTPYSPADEVDLSGKDMSRSTIKAQQDTEEATKRTMGGKKRTRKNKKKARKTRRRSRK